MLAAERATWLESPASRTAAFLPGRSWRSCSAGSLPRRVSPRSPLGTGAGAPRSASGQGARDGGRRRWGTCSGSARSLREANRRARACRPPTSAGSRRSRPSAPSSSRSRTSSGRTSQRGSSPRQSSSSRIAPRLRSWSRTSRWRGRKARCFDCTRYRLPASDVRDLTRSLSDAAAGELLTELLGEDLDPAARARLISEAEGNPLYLQELARALEEGSLEERGRTWTITMRSFELLPPKPRDPPHRSHRPARQPPPARADRGCRRPHVPRRRPRPRGRGQRCRRPGVALLKPRSSVSSTAIRSSSAPLTHGLLSGGSALDADYDRPSRSLRPSGPRLRGALADSMDAHVERLAHYHAQAGNLPQALEYAERARAASG